MFHKFPPNKEDVKAKYDMKKCFTGYSYNFEIRVGEDEDFGNNPICFKQITQLDSRSNNFTCSPVLFGDWISINKSSNDPADENLVLREVRVFSEYN